MNDSSSDQRSFFDAHFWGVVTVIAIGALLRLMPHIPNVSPISAMALFGGASLSRKSWALAIPLLAMLLSDCVLGFHAAMPAVYLSIAAMVTIGFWLQSRRGSVARIGLASLSGSILFFVVTNLWVWASGEMYPLNTQGLVTCFTAAIPFFQNSLVGDLFFSAAFFGAWAFAERTWPRLKEA